MIALVPHTCSTSGGGWNVSALGDRTAEGDLHLRYVVEGALDDIRVPPSGSPERRDRLWEHTCAEAFVAADGAPAYVELNFSPSRAWAAYAFTAYREPGAPLTTATPPRIDVRREPHVLTIDAIVTLAELAPAYRDAVLQVGLTMVVEATDGGLSYWALHHAGVRPDFHHADGFVLRLAPVRRVGASAHPERGPST